MPVHKLREGEDIVSIAAPRGIPWKKVWNHPENRALREKRTSPHVLMPGDEVFVPELEQKSESRGTESKHRFTAKGAKVRFRARLLNTPVDEDEKSETSSSDPSVYEEKPPRSRPPEPLADRPYELFVDGVSRASGSTDSDGFVDVTVPARSRQGTLIIDPGEVSERRIELNWRHMDPVEELSGVCQRLTNLGYPCPADANEMSPQIHAAIAAFQRQHDLEPDGKLSDALRSKLVEEHGS